MCKIGFQVLGILCISALIYAQDSRVKATRVVPLYCYIDVIRGYDSTCVNRVRITFKNSDAMKIRNTKFNIKISEVNGEENSTLYDAKHEVSIVMNPGETYSVTIPLLNPISPPEGESSFKNKKSWKWEVTIISINRR